MQRWIRSPVLCLLSADSGNRFVMFHNAALRAFIVVRRYDERGVCAKPLRVGSVPNRRCGAVASRSHYYRYSAVDPFNDETGSIFVFLGRYRGRFARSAERQKRRRAAVEKKVYVLAEHVAVDIAVAVEWRYHGDAAAFE